MKQVIRSHFDLQLTRYERASTRFGINPWLSYFIISIIFSVLSVIILLRGSLEQWEYIVPALILMFLISDADRLKFYKKIYSQKIYHQIRLIENFLISIPFILFLILFKAFIPGIALIILTLMASLFSNTVSSSIYLPTPFYKYPFEFAAGFRLSYLFIILLYIIFTIAAVVNNSYLGIFIFVITALSTTFYYQTQEAVYFIWIHKMSSQEFLIHKLKIALSYTFLTTLPMLITSIIIWPSMILWLVLWLIFALLFIASTIMAKYSMYPYIFNLPIALALSISFVIPPFLLVLFPYLFRRAANNLKPILS